MYSMLQSNECSCDHCSLRTHARRAARSFVCVHAGMNAHSLHRLHVVGLAHLPARLFARLIARSYTHAYTFAPSHVRTHARRYAGTHVRSLARTLACSDALNGTRSADAHMRMYAYTSTDTRASAYVHAHANAPACVRALGPVCVSVCTSFRLSAAQLVLAKLSSLQLLSAYYTPA